METYKKHELVDKELKAINGGVEVFLPFRVYLLVTERAPIEKIPVEFSTIG